MADQVIRNWKRFESVSGGVLVKITPFKPCLISINGTGTCDIVAYLISDNGDGNTYTNRNKHVVKSGATGDEAYTAQYGFSELGIENVVGQIDMEISYL